MSRHRFTERGRINAPVAEVWPLIATAARWKDWSFLTRSTLERPGSPDPEGVGAIRRFTALGVGSREEVVLFDPPRHLAYTILSGFPVRHYRADVILEPADGDPGTGTDLTWDVTFASKIPGTGGLMAFVLRRIIRSFVRGLGRLTSG